MIAHDSVLSLGFDEDQIGWALRNAEEAEALLVMARISRSNRISQKLVEKALAKSFGAIVRLISCTLFLDAQGQIAQAQVESHNPIVRMSNLWKICLSAAHEGRLSTSDMVQVGESLNRACLSIIDAVSASAQ